jgi:ABC-type nitrate/sulfonate/bicarbonate transport system permease component
MTSQTSTTARSATDAAQEAPARGRLRGAAAAPGLRNTVLRLLTLGVLLGIWQLVGNDAETINFPTFTRTASAFGSLIASGELPRALADSDTALAYGFLAAVAVSLPLGALLGSSRIAHAAVNPYMTVIMAVPAITVVPILQAMFGLGLTTRAVLIFLFTVPYLVTSTAAGIASLPEQLDQMSRSFSVTGLRRLRQVVLPQALPSMMSGLRLGLGHAIVGMVIAELYLVSNGIGSILSYYEDRFDAGRVFAIALATVIQGVILIGIARMAERSVLKKVRPT